MIAIAIDDSACLAVGAGGNVHVLSTDVIWTGHGWIIADMRDASALLEANRWAPFGEVVGLRRAMEAKDDFRLHYLAALFKRAAEALRAMGEPQTGDLAIAMPSSAVCWRGSVQPAEAESCSYFQPDDEEALRDFQRAAQIAGFKKVCVRPTARCLFERFPRRDDFKKQRQNRAAVVEVFRTGFSVVPVGAEARNSTTWSFLGRQLWIDHDVESWAVARIQQEVGESFEGCDLSPRIGAALAGNQSIRIDGARSGRAEEYELAPNVLGAVADYDRLLVGIPAPKQLVDLLRDPAGDKEYDPRYLDILVSGWLSGVPLVHDTLERFLREALRETDSVAPPTVLAGGALYSAAEGARMLAKEGPWVTSGSAEALALTRGASPPVKEAAEVKATGETDVRLDGAKRPVIGRLSWLVEAADRAAVATLRGGDARCHYRVEYRLQPWESRARVEAEVTMEQDDQVLLATLVDGRPAPALVTRLAENGQGLETISAIAPGRFQLYLNDEHKLVTRASQDFANGPRGVIARFATELEAS